MISRHKLLEELQLTWSGNEPLDSSFLASVSSVSDTSEIIQYGEAIAESAFICGKIDKDQYDICKVSVNRIATILTGKQAVPQLRAAMSAITPAQMLHSLLSFGDREAAGMEMLADQSSEITLELNPSQNNNGTITFLYAQHSGAESYFDRFINRAIPVNGDAQFCCYDNYLPIYKLMQKYFPEVTIRLVTDRSKVAGKYLYVVTFKYFPGYAKAMSHDYLAVVPPFVLDDCRNGNAVLVYNDLAESTFYPDFIGAIQVQLKAAGLANHFYLLSGDFANVALQHQPNLYQKVLHLFNARPNQFPLLVMDYFEEAMVVSKQLNYPDYNFKERLKSLQVNADKLHHFICLNRVVKDYRLYLSWQFYKYQLLDKSFVSQSAYNDFSDFQFGHNQNTIMLETLQGEQFDTFKQSLPWTLDFTNTSAIDWDSVPVDLLNQSFCWVVTETAFSTTLPQLSFRLTEKTYKPIAFFMPFLMVGNPGILKNLRMRGYQTFSKWWDESYDDMVDPLQRMEKIMEVILSLSKLSHSDLLKIYLSMESVLQHNYNLMMSTQSGRSAMEKLFNAVQST